MYIKHDRIKDTYKVFTTLSALSKKGGIPYDTLTHHFSRLKKGRMVTKDANVIIKVKPIKNSRKWKY